jgi:simple sugar transport system ATP-binding protein
LDVGSIEFVHEQILLARDSGIPVLIIATELDEATQLGDRVAVMYKGQIVGIVSPDTPREELGKLMAGVTQ